VIEKLFEPQSIAIIGASKHKEKLGFQILENIIESGFSGEIFPVNPEAGEILRKKNFAKVAEISQNIDLAIIVVPASVVPQVLKECVEKKISFVVIISAGFAESGNEGKKLQDKMADAFLAVWQVSLKEKVDLRTAAFMVAIRKIVENLH